MSPPAAVDRAPAHRAVATVSTQPGSDRRTYRLGLAGAALILLGFGLLATFAIAPFRSADESAGAAYGLAVSEGRLPTMDDQVVPQIPGQRNVRQHVANHPPLYYALVATPLGLGVQHGHPVAGLRAARLETLVFGLAGVLAAAAMAMGVRGRREVAVGTAAVTATVCSFTAVTTTVMNDALAMMFCTVALVGLVHIALRGLRPAPVAAVTLGAVGGLATRETAAPLVGLAVGGLLVAGVVHTRPQWRGLLVGLACANGLVALAALTVGWFYLRNQRLYGSLTGELYLGRRTTRLASLSEFLTRPRWYVEFAQLLAGRQRVQPTALTVVLGLLWSGVLAGAVIGLRGMVARRHRPSWPMRILVGMLVSLVGSLWVAIAVHVSVTGGLNPRYVFPGLAVLTLAVAGGLRAVPGGPPGLWLAAAPWAQAATVGWWLLVITDTQHPAPALDRLPAALRDAGVPLAPLVVLLLLGVVAAGLVLTSRSVLVLARRQPAGDPVPDADPTDAEAGPAAASSYSRPSRSRASQAAASVNAASSRPAGSVAGSPSARG